MILIWIWLVVVFVATVLYLRQVYSRFSSSGVKHFRPVPFLGNMDKMTLRKEHMCDKNERLYNEFPNERFLGSYEFLRPVVLIKDLELIKKITVRDFEYFLDHRVLFDKEVEPLFVRKLFSLKGQEWKDMRSTLSPAFTSSKIRLMVPLMLEVEEQMTSSLKRKINDSKSGYVDIECKDLMTRYANDVIASCAFGLKVDSFSQESNEFYVMGKEVSTLTFKIMLKFFLYNSFPKLMMKLQIPLLTYATKRFFTNLLKQTMEEREVRGVVRHDMIQLLVEAKHGKLMHDKLTEDDTGFATAQESDVGKRKVDRTWSEDDLFAQAMLFFIAGFETAATALTFTLFELALNPDVQDRLVKEIQKCNQKNNGRFNFDSIKHLNYLDMVISEVLRLWPPAVGTDRTCNKSYNLGRPSEEATKDFFVHPGDGIVIPIWSFHHSPEYFPDPYKFDPERFSEENKHNIKPFTYTPFGIGPRNCIGSRFALCEIKLALYGLLLNMEVMPCERTHLPIRLSPETFHLRMQGGHWLRFKMRT